MATNRKTRHEASTKLSDYLGKGKEMSQTELPTLRDCFQYGIFLRETNMDFMNHITHDTRVMAKEILNGIRERWERASAKFKPPVTATDKTIENKLVTLWDKASKIAWKHLTSAKEINNFEENLDKLFDITKCKCPIVNCEDVTCTGCHCGEKDCTGCPKPGTSSLVPCHIICKCPADQKLPLIELSFIRAQREKVGEKSAAMIGNADKKESKKQIESEEKRVEREKKKALKEQRDADKAENERRETAESAARVEEFWAEPSTGKEDDLDNNDKENNEWMEVKTSERNMTNIRNVAMASIRYGVSANAAAAICNATLLDYGLISQDNTINVVDAMKVQRAKDKLYKELQERAAMKYKEENIVCILFDGRKDWTLMYEEVEGSSQAHPAIRKEEHYSVVSEPGGQYLFHFTPDEADKEHSAAEQIAITLVEWMKKYDVDKTLQFIGGDSTNVNSGIWGGVFQFVEKMLGRPLNWIVCGLHLNELPLRHLMADLDGPTTSDTGFSGPVGKALAGATELPVKKSFKKITIGSDLIALPEDVRKDLSTDQKYGYDIVEAIRTGEVSQRLANLDIGPINHSRWLTFANRMCRLYVSDHGLKGKAAKNLRLIVEYIVGVYYPTWFMYKVRNNWVEGALICFEQLQLTLLQDKQVIKIVFPRLESSAWWAHSKMLLQTLLCSSDEADRRFAVEKILEVRQLGDVNLAETVRTRSKISLNSKASTLKELIIWKENEISEPVLTLDLTEEQIRSFENSPMPVPYIPVHGQSMERCVKEVTAAAEAVFGYERRDGFIRARLEHRTLTGGLLKSKRDHARIVGEN
jgi:hypothetical protein